MCGLPIFTATPLSKPLTSIGTFNESISSLRGISFQSVVIFPIFTLISSPAFFAINVPASDRIFRVSFLLFSSKRIFATHLVPFPHASALSPAGLKISILTSALPLDGLLIVMSWSQPAPVLRSLNF